MLLLRCWPELLLLNRGWPKLLLLLRGWPELLLGSWPELLLLLGSWLEPLLLWLELLLLGLTQLLNGDGLACLVNELGDHLPLGAGNVDRLLTRLAKDGELARLQLDGGSWECWEAGRAIKCALRKDSAVLRLSSMPTTTM